MDKLLALLQQLANSSSAAAAALSTLAAGLPAGAIKDEVLMGAAELRKLPALVADAEAFLAHPDFNVALEYARHHGNLPGSPEDRAAAAAAGLSLEDYKKSVGR